MDELFRARGSRGVLLNRRFEDGNWNISSRVHHCGVEEIRYNLALKLTRLVLQLRVIAVNKSVTAVSNMRAGLQPLFAAVKFDRAFLIFRNRAQLV